MLQECHEDLCCNSIWRLGARAFHSHLPKNYLQTDIMQLQLTNLCLLSYQLILTSGLRVIDNGLGEAVYYEENIFDDALLAADTEAALPSQVLLLLLLMFFFSSPSAHLQLRMLCWLSFTSFNFSASLEIPGSHLSCSLFSLEMKKICST